MICARKHTAISAALAALLLSTTAFAGPATITRTSGPLLAQSPSGAARIVAVESRVRRGDTIASAEETYAEVALDGGGTAMLGPQTEARFEERSVTLVRGSIRVASGRERVTLTTPLGELDIRDATVLVQYAPAAEATARASLLRFASLAVASDAVAEPLVLAQLTPPKPPTSGGLAPGLHVFVIDGAILLKNGGGTQSFSTGQFGYVRTGAQAPIVVPQNPGLKFAPPPTFASSNTQAGRPGGSTGSQNTVDCEVR